MKNEEIGPRTIEGDWDWREINANLNGKWVTLEEKPAGDHVWSFIGNSTMLSQAWEQLRYVATYRFDPVKLLLALDGWRLDRHCEREMIIRERYRMEFPSPSEMLLYDLEDVEPGTEETRRLKLRKTVPVENVST